MYKVTIRTSKNSIRFTKVVRKKSKANSIRNGLKGFVYSVSVKKLGKKK